MENKLVTTLAIIGEIAIVYYVAKFAHKAGYKEGYEEGFKDAK